MSPQFGVFVRREPALQSKRVQRYPGQAHKVSFGNARHIAAHMQLETAQRSVAQTYIKASRRIARRAERPRQDDRVRGDALDARVVRTGRAILPAKRQLGFDVVVVAWGAHGISVRRA